MTQMLHTTGEVIEAVGGLSRAARLNGRGYTAAWNWKKAGKFPANTYVTLQTALHEQDKSAPAALWGMVEPERVSA